jgi:hypothetical protein
MDFSVRPHASFIVLSRRLEDRIRELCRRALTASDTELDSIFSALNAALREHTEKLRRLMVIKLASKTGDQPPDRRSA